MSGVHSASRLFRFAAGSEAATAACKSHRLLTRGGFVQHGSATGCLSLCPLATRSLTKLTSLIDAAMSEVGAQRMLLPMLASASLWQRTKRWDAMGAEMFRLKDRHGKSLCLQPTHEEEMTRSVAMETAMSHRALPLLLYQIQWKFRDEPLPKRGLLRSREFLMKDLYSFHADQECARRAYSNVCDAYSRLLGDRLGLPYARVEADNGGMGGSESTEFHVLAAAGEDRLLICNACGLAANSDTRPKCPASGGGSCEAVEADGVEVAHCFLLGDGYAKRLGLGFVGVEPREGRRTPTMGCYGIGVTRLLAACVEAASSEEALRWPTALAPFRLALTPQKAGAGDEVDAEWTAALKEATGAACGSDELLHDDRLQLTVGRRLRDHRLWGLPCSLVVKGNGKGGGGGVSCELVDNWSGEKQFFVARDAADARAEVEKFLTTRASNN